MVRSARDTHDAWADRFGGSPRGGPRSVPDGSTAASPAPCTAASASACAPRRPGSTRWPRPASGRGWRTAPRGRFVSSAVNGLIGDRLVRERPRLAIPMAVRAARARRAARRRTGLAAAFPDATGRVVVFLHGLCENESYWNRGRERTGTTYGETLAGAGWTPVFLRANTGLGLRENGAALSALMQRLVEAWPVPVTRIALVGHSMGGLIMRAAGAVATRGRGAVDRAGLRRRHARHAAPRRADRARHRARQPGLARLPETAAFGRILDWRSVGVHDLVAGLAEDVPPLPHARYRLVAATLTARPRHPVGHVVGDLLVRVPSAYGRDRRGRELFPGADVLHVGRTDHFGLLNHPDVHARCATGSPEAAGRPRRAEIRCWRTGGGQAVELSVLRRLGSHS